MSIRKKESAAGSKSARKRKKSQQPLMKLAEVFENLNGSDQVPELKLVYKATLIERHRLDNPEKAVEFLRKVFDEGTIDLLEEMVLVLLNGNYMPIGYYKLAKGGKAETLTDDRLVLQILLATGAEAFILAHNHPGGLKYPSDKDFEAVAALKLKADFFGIDYHDEIILTTDDHWSFAEHSMIW